MRSQLLLTFTYLDRLPVSIGQIFKAYTVDGVSNMKCYCYVEVPASVVCVYNVQSTERRLKDTISINRKKESNTFYSINALNSLICALNNGVLDKTFVVDWSNYTDTLLLSDNENSYKQIKIKELAQ
jgi:hypothetical protein